MLLKVFLENEDGSLKLIEDVKSKIIESVNEFDETEIMSVIIIEPGIEKYVEDEVDIIIEDTNSNHHSVGLKRSAESGKVYANYFDDEHFVDIIIQDLKFYESR